MTRIRQVLKLKMSLEKHQPLLTWLKSQVFFAKVSKVIVSYSQVMQMNAVTD